MARSGAFSGPSPFYGAPLLSAHPIDNQFKTDQKELTVEDVEKRSRPGVNFTVTEPKKDSERRRR